MWTVIAPKAATAVIPAKAATAVIPAKVATAVIPAKAGIQCGEFWIPAFAGMTGILVIAA